MNKNTGMTSAFYSIELAQRWTPKCPGCKQPTLGAGRDTSEICRNQTCKYEGYTPRERVLAFNETQTYYTGK
jgi:hypothetical protein